MKLSQFRRFSTQLNQQNLANLSAKVQVPNYDRTQVSSGIVHLGVGGFSRSHLKIYTDDVLSKDKTWGITGSGLLSFDEKMNNAMTKQDCLYTCVTKGADDSVSARVVGSMVDYVWAGKDQSESKKLLDKMTDKDTRVVTMTVTEKGYTADLTKGVLDMTNPANQWMSKDSDALRKLIDGRAPNMSALGYVTAALERRRQLNHDAFTVMSCDNL